MKINKKFIIISAILAIAAVSTFAFIWLRSGNQITEESQEEIFQQPPELPRNEFSVTNASKDGKELYQEARWKAQDSKNQNISETYFRDKSREFLPLNRFLGDNGLKINPEISKNLDQKTYSAFFCPLLAGEESVGLMIELVTGIDILEKVGMIDETEENLLNWEKTLFFDLKPIFYPNDTLEDSAKFQFSNANYISENGLTETVIRYANTKSIEGKNLSLDYTFFNEQIFISNNKDCLRRMIDLYQDSSEP